jgi:hypothetical protein
LGVCLGCATAPVPSTPAVDPWALLLEGDVSAAQKAFDELSRADRSAGLHGQLVIASMRRDPNRIRELLASAPRELPAPVLIAAGEAALLLDPPDVPWAERACALRTGEPLRKEAEAVCAELELARAFPRRKVCSAGCDVEHRFPLRFAGNSPVVLVSVNGRPPAPFIVDSGAAHSVLTTAFAREAGITAVPGTGHQVGSTGGEIPTEIAVVDLKAGALELGTVDVRLIDLPVRSVAGILSPHSTLAAFRTTLDFQNFELLVSSQPASEPGLVELPLLFHDSNPHVFMKLPNRPARPFVLDTGADSTRLFTASTAGSVDLAIKLEHGKGTERFHLRMPDTWASRGTWLLTRPALLAWTGEGADRSPLEPKALQARWLNAFMPLQSLPGETTVTMTTATLDGRELSCTELRLPAKSAKGTGHLTMLECPQEPWRVLRIQLTADDKPVWEYRRVGLTTR